jgi:hypothetical protein
MFNSSLGSSVDQSLRLRRAAFDLCGAQANCWPTRTGCQAHLLQCVISGIDYRKTNKTDV